MVLKPKAGIRDEIGARAKRRRANMREQSGAQLLLRPPRNDLTPKLQTVTLLIDELKPAAHAVRKLLDAQVNRTMRSIQVYGFVLPVLVKADGTIIKGRTRVEAAKRLGITEIPCIVIDHLTPEELRTLTLTLSRLPELGEWDFDALSIEIGELFELGAPLEVSGFTLPELDALTLFGEPAPEIEQAAEPEPGPAVTKPGQMWLAGDHKVFCGDSREAAVYDKLLGPDLVRLVLTDVPFNVKITGHVSSSGHREFAMASGEMKRGEFESFNTDWMTLCKKYLMKGALLATFIDWRSVELIMAVGRALGLDLLNLVVWAKSNGGMGSLWRSQHELLPVFKNPGAATSTTSSSASTVAGVPTSGNIPEPPAWALTPATAWPTIRRSIPSPCWKTPCWTSPSLAILCSNPSRARGRR
jgi:hypothetical protein